MFKDSPAAPIVVSISDLSVRHGRISSSQSGVNEFEGGGVLNASGSTLALTRVALRDNQSLTTGAGISNHGQLTIMSSSIDNNDAIQGAGTGGGVANSGTLALVDSTVAENGAFAGGGIVNSGNLTITNSTISMNESLGAGGISHTAGTLTMTSSTVAGNAGNASISAGSPATVKNTIVAGGPTAACTGTITSLGHNLSNDSSCGFTATGDQQNANPMLGPLASNGGPTQTHALLAGSPAIDAGSLDCPPPAADQRGVTRQQDGNATPGAVFDIGAVERVPAPNAASAGYYRPVTPARILDTRDGAPPLKLGAGATIPAQVTNVGGVPATGVTAVVLNTTVTEPTAGSFLTLYPYGGALPTASNLNFAPGQTVPNLVTVKVGDDGKVNIYNAGRRDARHPRYRGLVRQRGRSQRLLPSGGAGADSRYALQPARGAPRRGRSGRNDRGADHGCRWGSHWRRPRWLSIRQ